MGIGKRQITGICNRNRRSDTAGIDHITVQVQFKSFVDRHCRVHREIIDHEDGLTGLCRLHRVLKCGEIKRISFTDDLSDSRIPCRTQNYIDCLHFDFIIWSKNRITTPPNNGLPAFEHGIFLCERRGSHIAQYYNIITR